MADATKYLNELSNEKLKLFQTTFNATEVLVDERKTLNEEIKGEIDKCAGELGWKPKEVRQVLKTLRERRTGVDVGKYNALAEKIENAK
jgi:uncharacterized protein (UPF0335 family)